MEDYGGVLAQGEENLKRIEEDGSVVAVLEKRAVSAKREGYFVIQVGRKCTCTYCVLLDTCTDRTVVYFNVYIHVIDVSLLCLGHSTEVTGLFIRGRSGRFLPL